MNTKLAVDVLDMGSNRTHCNVELLSNLSARQTGGQEMQHLQFALAEGLDQRLSRGVTGSTPAALSTWSTKSWAMAPPRWART